MSFAHYRTAALTSQNHVTKCLCKAQ